MCSDSTSTQECDNTHLAQEKSFVSIRIVRVASHSRSKSVRCLCSSSDAARKRPTFCGLLAPRVRSIFLNVRCQLPRCGDDCRAGLLEATRFSATLGRTCRFRCLCLLWNTCALEVTAKFSPSMSLLTVLNGVGETSTSGSDGTLEDGPVVPIWSCCDKQPHSQQRTVCGDLLDVSQYAVLRYGYHLPFFARLRRCRRKATHRIAAA